MRQVVYADIVFLMNFCMDFLSLFAAGKILGLKLSLPRLVLSSALGALYAVSTFLYDPNKVIIPQMVLNIAVSVVMCFVAFNIGSIISFTKIFVIFYAACFMLGGGIEALYYISGLVKTEDINDLSLNIPPVQVIVILAGVCAFIVIIAGSLFKRRSSVKEAEITIGFMGKEATVTAIVDSGNLLCEPISSLPVIIVKLSAVVNLLDLKMLNLFVYDSPSYLANISDIENPENPENIDNIKMLKFRIVPLKSVGGENSILPAFFPDYIKCRKKAKKDGKTGKISDINAVIAVDGKSNEKYGEKYAGIVPAVLIE